MGANLAGTSGKSTGFRGAGAGPTRVPRRSGPAAAKRMALDRHKPQDILTDQTHVPPNQLTWPGPATPICKLEIVG